MKWKGSLGNIHELPIYQEDIPSLILKFSHVTHVSFDIIILVKGLREVSMMVDWRERITIDPEIMYGKPVITGTRIPVEHILRKLAADISVETILRDFPDLTKEDIHAALAFASDSVGNEDTFLVRKVG